MNEQKAEGAWERARAAEDLQVGWTSSKHLLEEAIASGFDPQLMRKFLARVRRLAHDVGTLEPSLLKGWGVALTLAVAAWVGREVRLKQGGKGLGDELVDAFAGLDWEGADE